MWHRHPKWANDANSVVWLMVVTNLHLVKPTTSAELKKSKHNKTRCLYSLLHLGTLTWTENFLGQVFLAKVSKVCLSLSSFIENTASVENKLSSSGLQWIKNYNL